jgi:ABC-2 type transport system permease protein
MKKQYLTQNSLDLFSELVKTSFKLRYNNSFLGFLWVLLKPLMLFLILYIVWSRLLGNNQENYRLYLLLGVMMYTFFSEGINMGMNALVDKAHIILKVNFPRQIAVLSSTVMAVINFSINLIIFTIFSIFDKAQPTVLSILYFCLIALVIYLFILGVAFFSSVFLVYLRDLSNITEIGLQLLFWGTPIFYSISSEVLLANGGTDGTIRAIVAANPIGIVINTARSALIYGQIENTTIIFAYLAFTLFLCATGVRFFSNKVKRIAESF